MFFFILDSPNFTTIDYQNLSSISTFPIDIKCVPDGNPQIYTFMKWQHHSLDNVLIRELQGSDTTTTSTISIPLNNEYLQYQDAGYYTCSVSNGIPSTESLFAQQRYFSVDGKI